MTKSQRLKPVTQLAERKEHDAARLLAAAQKVVEQREQRLTELLSYAAEYQQRLQNAGRAGIEAGQLHDYQAFIVKLDEAIIHQRAMLEAAARELDERRSQWHATHNASMALDKVVTRYRHEEIRSGAQREQAESDERAQRLPGNARRDKD